jgi:hypothetical protein
VRREFHGHGRFESRLGESVGRDANIPVGLGAVVGGGEGTPIVGMAEGGELLVNIEGDNVGTVLGVEEVGESVECVHSSALLTGYKGATQNTTFPSLCSSFDGMDTDAAADTPVYP